MGPKKYFKNKLVVAEDMANKMQSLADFCLIIDQKELEFKSKQGKQDYGVPFFAFGCEYNQKVEENKLGSFLRYERIFLGIQEFFLKIESRILSRILVLIWDISSAFSSEDNGQRAITEEIF